MNPVHVGVLLNSALYLSCCFIAGLTFHNGVAWRCAIAAMGVAYLGYLTQVSAERTARFDRVIAPLVWLSVGLGVAAGVALVF